MALSEIKAMAKEMEQELEATSVLQLLGEKMAPLMAALSIVPVSGRTWARLSEESVRRC